MANSVAQLFLLSDHIKLSLLERERAASLSLNPNSQQTGELSRSLDSFRTQLEELEASADTAPSKDVSTLRQQYEDLKREFDGALPGAPESTLDTPNSASLAPDFNKATTRGAKSVRFHDNPADAEAEAQANRAALMPYRDEPEESPDHSALDNQQIHQYHSQVMRDQDEQLDTLGRSIGRQRELSIQIGDELEGQTEMLDEIDEGVDRHQRTLNRARQRLGKVARKAKDNASMVIIISLIVILVLLVVITK